jgi:hypothetical protein
MSVSRLISYDGSALTRGRIVCCTLNNGMASLACLPRLVSKPEERARYARTRPNVASEVVDAGKRLRASSALEEIVVVRGARWRARGCHDGQTTENR